MTRTRLNGIKWPTRLAAGCAAGAGFSIGLHAGIVWLGLSTGFETPDASIEPVVSVNSQAGPVEPKRTEIPARTEALPSREAVPARTATRAATATATSLAGLEARVSEAPGRDGAADRDMAVPVPALRPAGAAIQQAAVPALKPELPPARAPARSTGSATDMAEGGPIPLFGADLPDTIVRQAALPRPEPAAPSQAEQAPEPNQVFADAQPLTGSELGEMRGGFFNVDGWKIAFGVQIDVKINDFTIVTKLNDVTRMRGIKVDVGSDRLVRTADGSFKVNGKDVSNGKPFNLGSIQANLEEKEDGGFDLTTTGEHPFTLSVERHKVTQEVGTDGRTLIRHALSPEKIISQLNNVANHAENSSRATVDIDILNHDERVSVARRFLATERLNRHIQSGLISRIVK